VTGSSISPQVSLPLRVMLIAAWLALAASSPASAQAPVSVSLDQAVARAIEHAPRLAETRAREAAARASHDAKRSTALPSATVSSGFTRTNHVDEVLIPLPTGGTRVLFPDIPNNYRVRGELVVPVYAFGRVGATLDASRSDIDAAAAEVRASEADVRLDTARAYWGLVSAREAVRVLEQALARTDAYVADVKARVDAGILPPNDVLSAQAQRARQFVRLVQARNEQAIAELDLGRLIGEPPDTRIVPSSDVQQPSAEAAGLISTSAAELASRSEQRPERDVLSARSASLRALSAAALANLRPYITGLAAVEPARPNVRFVPPTDTWRTSWSLGVNATWPLFDSGRSRAEASALRSQADALDARRREFDDLVGLEVRQRLLEIDAGRAALMASGEAVTTAAEARRVVEERFRAGVATSTDVLDAQVALLEAEVEQTRLHATLRIAEARLIRAVGTK
jgi:outer membrane protein